MNECLTNLGMSTEHRNKIRSNFNTLVLECNIDQLLPKLIEKKVFSIDMAEKYQSNDKKENKRLLFVDITRRGPEAFYHLVTSLHETGQDHLADILSSYDSTYNEAQYTSLKINEMHKKQAKPFQLPNNMNESIQITIKDVTDTTSNLEVIHSTKFYDINDTKVQCYPTRSKTRGKVLIINNISFVTDEERVGAEVDQANLLKLFNQMGGFSIEPHKNKTFKEIEGIILNFVKSPDLLEVDVCFVFILSHGTENKIITSDGALLSTEWIEEKFNNVNCPFLKFKPKVLLYQACRGAKTDENIRENVQTDSPVSSRTYSDLLICHSTLLGWKSHRDPNLGTWFIEQFCSIFAKHAHDTHIESLLKMVDNSIAKLRSFKLTSQTSTYHSIGFNSHCYIHPGIYEENGRLKQFEIS